MRFVRTLKIRTHAVGHLLGREQPIRCDNVTLTMYPMWLDRVEPRALDRQRTRNKSHAFPVLFHLLIVLAYPVLDGATDVPRRIVPRHEQGDLTLLLQLRTAPVQELRRDVTHGATINEAQPDRILFPGGVGWARDEQSIAGQGFRIRIVGRNGLFDHAHGMVGVRPGMHGWRRQTTPPCLVFEAQGPVRVGGHDPLQAITRPFFRVYSGSGLLIQRLTRRH